MQPPHNSSIIVIFRGGVFTPVENWVVARHVVIFRIMVKIVNWNWAWQNTLYSITVMHLGHFYLLWMNYLSLNSNLSQIAGGCFKFFCILIFKFLGTRQEHHHYALSGVAASVFFTLHYFLEPSTSLS